jgi:FtsP/CotA-like multicopper oxidase with cupredoxin domain
MKVFLRILGAGLVSPLGGLRLTDAAGAKEGSKDPCRRPIAGDPVPEPRDLRSEDGVLELDLTMRNVEDTDASARYCYLLPDGTESPTLRLSPGDELVLRLRNALVPINSAGSTAALGGEICRTRPTAQKDACTEGPMTALSTNLHFHGMTVPARCHQDDVLRTSIQPTDPVYEYRFKVPVDESPGLYWYHPHVHGLSSKQVMGGASGALIIEGIERANPELRGLAERVLIVRDQDLLHPDAPASLSEPSAQALLDRDGDVVNTGTGSGKPAKDLSVNFVPVPYPEYPITSIVMKPGERQLWRLLNACSVTYLNIAALYKRGPKFRPQWLGVVAIDGVPIATQGSPGHPIEWRDSIVVAPGARVEFIMVGPPAGVPGMLITRTVDTGIGGENDPTRPLISITASAQAVDPQSRLPAASEPLPAPSRPWLGSVAPVRIRRLYFSEDDQDPNRPQATPGFYLTVEGQPRAVFDPLSSEPNIIARQGDVEDWIIENRTSELHAFHIHQLHFQLVAWMGLAINEPFLRDTVNVPYATSNTQAVPSVRLRMDFRDPDSVGTFVYHCHLLDHEDAGMMGRIRVDPALAAADVRHVSPKPSKSVT